MGCIPDQALPRLKSMRTHARAHIHSSALRVQEHSNFHDGLHFTPAHACPHACILARMTQAWRVQEHSDWHSFFDDGLHFTPVGNQQVLRLLLETLDASYPHLR